MAMVTGIAIGVRSDVEDNWSIEQNTVQTNIDTGCLYPLIFSRHIDNNYP